MKLFGCGIYRVLVLCKMREAPFCSNRKRSRPVEHQTAPFPWKVPSCGSQAGGESDAASLERSDVLLGFLDLSLASDLAQLLLGFER